MHSVGQISTQLSHSMQVCAVNTVAMSQFRQREASEQAFSTSKPSSSSSLMSFNARPRSITGIACRSSSEMSLS
jgi:hypothetical protein